MVIEEDLQNVQHAGHLCEDEHAMTRQFQLPQERVQSL